MTKKYGTLTLIPTPIDENSKLSFEALEQLLRASGPLERSNSVFVIEDLKPGRILWLKSGLPRESVESFKQLNEHNAKESTQELIQFLKSGKNVFLMSDGGMPAFCDPGQELVYRCHKEKIKVTSTPFSNSVILALALSGLSHKKFVFQGFLPLDNHERKSQLVEAMNSPLTQILMDTPYRLKRLLDELHEIKGGPNKECFVGLDLNASTEELHLGTPNELLNKIKDFKREFVLIIGNSN